MDTRELIAFLKTQEFTDTQAYNLLVADLFDAVPMVEIERSQPVIRFFEYKIREVLLPVIRGLKGA